jgi:hypothetical protein
MRKISFFAGVAGVVPDWRWNMDWRGNRDFDPRTCCFDGRSICDDDDCKGSAYLALRRLLGRVQLS